jgi:hypothetical protein
MVYIMRVIAGKAYSLATIFDGFVSVLPLQIAIISQLTINIDGHNDFGVRTGLDALRAGMESLTALFAESGPHRHSRCSELEDDRIKSSVVFRNWSSSQLHTNCR